MENRISIRDARKQLEDLIDQRDGLFDLGDSRTQVRHRWSGILRKTLAVLTGVGVGAHLASYWARRAGKKIAGKPVDPENADGEVK